MYLIFKTQSWSQTSPTHFMWISLCILWYSRPRWHCTGVTKSCSSVSVEQAGQLPVSPTGGSDAFTAGWDAYFDPFCQSGTTFVYFKNPFAPSLQLIYLQQNLLSPAAVSFYFVCAPLPPSLFPPLRAENNITSRPASRFGASLLPTPSLTRLTVASHWSQGSTMLSPG